MRSTSALILALVLAVCVAPAQAAVTLVQHATNRNTASAATVAITVSSTGSGNLIVVGCRNDGGHTVSGVSDGTNAFTQFASAAIAGTGSLAGVNLDVWYLLSSTSGKTTITITYNASALYNKDGWVWEVSGMGTVSTDGVNTGHNTGSAGSVETGVSVTTTSTTGFLIGLDSPLNNVLLNPNTGNEFSAGGDNQNGNGGVSLISTTAASHTPQWTGDTANDPFDTVTAAFKGTATTTCTPTMTLLGVGRCG